VLLTCLQIGYATGLFSRPIPSKLQQLGKTRAAPPAHGGLPAPAFFLKSRANDDECLFFSFGCLIFGRTFIPKFSPTSQAYE
jgi:hypothetical protein